MTNRDVTSHPAPDDLMPLHWYRRILRRSLWVLAAAVVGGVLGLATSQVTPPEYLATAVLTIGVDYARSQWLDEDADRLVMGRVQDLILSDDVLARALERAAAGSGAGPSPISTISELRDSLRLEWADTRWELSFSSSHPEQAAGLANAWGEAALERLQAASAHAWRVAELQALYFRVFCKPEDPAEGATQAFWVCDEGDPASQTSGLPGELQAEIEASHGIIPALSFSWATRAVSPSEPQHSGRPLMILSGLVIGLLAGALAAAATGEPRG
jgi:uncharacterized protein involved in exopolysaccharide biosynthesis